MLKRTFAFYTLLYAAIAVNMTITPLDVIPFRLTKIWFWGAIFCMLLLHLSNKRSGLKTWYHEKVNNMIIKNICFLAGIFVFYYVMAMLIPQFSNYEYIFAGNYMIFVSYDLICTYIIGSKNNAFSTDIV